MFGLFKSERKKKIEAAQKLLLIMSYFGLPQVHERSSTQKIDVSDIKTADNDITQSIKNVFANNAINTIDYTPVGIAYGLAKAWAEEGEFDEQKVINGISALKSTVELTAPIVLKAAHGQSQEISQETLTNDEGYLQSPSNAVTLLTLIVQIETIGKQKEIQEARETLSLITQALESQPS